MNANTLVDATERFAQRSMQLVLVRANGPLFYTVAAASVLESMAPAYTARLRKLFQGDHELSAWLDNVWLPAKAARAAALRDYVQKTWPELDWTAAYEHCRALVETAGAIGPQKPTAAHEALGRCVAAAQTGVLYRALARWADDPRLREMTQTMALEEALSFAQFRAAYERKAREQRFGLICAWRAATACMRRARDLHLALAFHAVSTHCGANVPFPVLEYGQFVIRMRAVVQRHATLSSAERFLLRAWKSQPRVARSQEARPLATGFRPIFKAAA